MPTTEFLKIICPRCKNTQTVYSKATSRIKCLGCNKLLLEPTGGKTKIRAGIKKIIKAK
jgi:small subunit ribosomal protein S27e